MTIIDVRRSSRISDMPTEGLTQNVRSLSNRRGPVCLRRRGCRGQREIQRFGSGFGSPCEHRGIRVLSLIDPTALADHLRYERYVNRVQGPAWKKVVRSVYYWLRPALPVPLRRQLQRIWLTGWEQKPFPKWPVDRTVDRMFEKLMALSLRAQQNARIPFVWFWPEEDPVAPS